MKIRKRMGPKTDLCGTSLQICFQNEEQPWIHTLCFLFHNNCWIQIRILPRISWFHNFEGDIDVEPYQRLSQSLIKLRQRYPPSLRTLLSCLRMQRMQENCLNKSDPYGNHVVTQELINCSQLIVPQRSLLTFASFQSSGTTPSS